MIIKKHLLTIFTIIIIIITTLGCIENNEDKIILTVTYNNYTADYTLKDLESIESYTGTGRYIKTKLLPDSIVIEDSHSFTGVKVNTLLNEISELPNNYNISIISSDDWTTTYTLNEINGIVDIFDETGNLTNGNTEMILAYKEDGKFYSEIDPENEIGPLRVAFIGNDIITSSSLWSKMVVKIEIIEIN
jgi:uncharacterized membrane protein